MGGAPAEGSDAAIYPDLARVNLLRMRGDFKAALQHGRAILHKFPNNVTANQLLGDLCLETGDLEQAKEWYELALDIAPKHPQIEKKLNDVRQKLEQEETAGLVEQLGLPPAKSKNGLVAIGIAAMVIVIAGIAYLLGTQKPKSEVASGAPKQTQISAPINTPTAQPDPPSSNTLPPVQSNPASTAASTEESTLQGLVSQRSQKGGRLLGLSIDPRTGLMTLSFQIDASEDRQSVAIDLASTALENSPNTRIVTVRGMENGVLDYMADVRREAYEESKTDAWKQANPDSAALVKHLLTQEWPASPPPSGDANQTTGSTGP